MDPEMMKLKLAGTEFCGNGAIAVHHSVVARAIGVGEGELVAFVKGGLRIGTVDVRYTEHNQYIGFLSDAQRAKSLAQEKEWREEAQRTAAGGQSAGLPESAHALLASAQRPPVPATPASAGSAKPARPAAPSITVEDLFRQSVRRNEQAQAWAKSLTKPKAEAADDPVGIGRRARVLKDERPYLSIKEAINLARKERGLPTYQI